MRWAVKFKKRKSNKGKRGSFPSVSKSPRIDTMGHQPPPPRRRGVTFTSNVKCECIGLAVGEAACDKNEKQQMDAVQSRAIHPRRVALNPDSVKLQRTCYLTDVASGLPRVDSSASALINIGEGEVNLNVSVFFLFRHVNEHKT